MVYNMTAFENSNDLSELFGATNTLSDGILVNFGLITVWTIIFFVLLRNNPPRGELRSQ